MKRKGVHLKMNVQQNLERIIEENKDQQVKPRLLLHSCCAPCSTYVLDYLKDSFQIVALFFNPNMDSDEEYQKRAEEMTYLVQQMNLNGVSDNQIQLVIKEYQSELFYSQIRGLEDEPERGGRCLVCFRLRLMEAARMAVENQCEYFATTLTISPLKNATVINQIGEEIASQCGVAYLPTDFKKKNGYLKSTEISKEYHLYRQDYCGCVFSKRESEARYEQKKL